MSRVLSVNTGVRVPFEGVRIGESAIGKRPVEGAVALDVPGAGMSGVSGDEISDEVNHGGPDQAVYAYAREELAVWEAELGRELPAGLFGENLTTEGVAVSDALVGERWRVGTALLEVTAPRIPCRTFALVLDEPQWVKRFTARALPGAYLRVLEPGSVRAGDGIEVVERPEHGITAAVVFRALQLEPGLLPSLVGVAGLSEEVREKVAKRVARARRGAESGGAGDGRGAAVR
ncbi:MOSC domain-containing protein [Actinosynnema mirum]|uniref:MOSC domain containing protein n=2 Tax=Actinosynnema TaxID=40566 RepID=C6W965_ACTMD|nr:MOSC domain-containing protein [Actinosynnema mirum]ACU39137.1 MOSC domain containing protein [Actinosynnema mirum DSM 43827]